MPPFTKHREVLVELLGALDERIDLNRRMNETLEAMAQTIFSERHGQGKWPERPLGWFAEIFDGPHATPKLTEAGPIFLGISNLSSGMLDLASTSRISRQDFENWTRRVTPGAGDVVFSYETRLGEAALIPSEIECCLGRRMGLLRIKHTWLAPAVLLRAYLAPDFQEVLRKRTIHGSTVDRIPLKEMATFPIRLPDAADVIELASVLTVLREKLEANQRETGTLSDLRDLLLPKLMSGEPRVRDAERVLEDIL